MSYEELRSIEQDSERAEHKENEKEWDEVPRIDWKECEKCGAVLKHHFGNCPKLGDVIKN